MLVPNIAQHHQTPSDIHRLAVEHPCPRTRERYFVFSKILFGYSASRVAKELGKDRETITRWIRRYNDGGPKALEYRHTGGRKPAFSPRGEADRQGDAEEQTA